MALRLLLPPSVGVARARARGELLERSLATELGERVDVAVAPDYEALARVALAGGAEIVWAPAAICVELESSARAIMKTVRAGRSSYRSALVARADAHLALERLAGTRAAWVDRRSVGGYLLVAKHLRDRGIEPDRTFASQVFLGTHPAALSAVMEGDADVAAVSVSGPHEADAMEALAQHAGRTGALRLAPLAITDAAPNDALVLTSALDPERAASLRARFFPKDGGRPRVASLCLAMECDGFEAARPGEYAPLRAILAATPR